MGWYYQVQKLTIWSFHIPKSKSTLVLSLSFLMNDERSALAPYRTRNFCATFCLSQPYRNFSKNFCESLAQANPARFVEHHQQPARPLQAWLGTLQPAVCGWRASYTRLAADGRSRQAALGNIAIP